MLASAAAAVLRRRVAAGLGSYQREEALVVLLAGRAALEVGAHPGTGAAASITSLVVRDDLVLTW
jgi:hypothetical protein